MVTSSGNIVMKRIVFAVLLLLITAGDVLGAGVYTVEVLVFARDDLASTEYFPPDPGSPDYTGAATLEELGFSEIASSSGTLGPEKYTLAKYGEAEPLYHKVWRQPMRSRTSPDRIHISTGSDDPLSPPLLEGVLELGAGRFFHIGVDLLLRGQRLSAAAGVRQIGPSGPGYQFYRMTAQRKMKRNELHFIDHPKMGILVVIRR